MKTQRKTAENQRLDFETKAAAVRVGTQGCEKKEEEQEEEGRKKETIFFSPPHLRVVDTVSAAAIGG